MFLCLSPLRRQAASLGYTLEDIKFMRALSSERSRVVRIVSSLGPATDSLAPGASARFPSVCTSSKLFLYTPCERLAHAADQFFEAATLGSLRALYDFLRPGFREPRYFLSTPGSVRGRNLCASHRICSAFPTKSVRVFPSPTFVGRHMPKYNICADLKYWGRYFTRLSPVC